MIWNQITTPLKKKKQKKLHDAEKPKLYIRSHSQSSI